MNPSVDESAERRRLIERDIIHDEDHAANRRKLAGLYGRVAAAQNALICRNCLGPKVLDVGAGYGNLTAALAEAGFDATGIEIDPEKIAHAAEWFNVTLLPGDIHKTDFAAGQFDTVVFREVVNHLRLPEALAEAARIARRRIVIFQHNRILALRAALWLTGHKEHARYDRPGMIRMLADVGFRSVRVRYRDVLAFPLSGGYIGRQLLPNWRWLLGLTMAVDRAAAAGLTGLGLGRWTCFRMMIVAERG